MAPVLNTNSFPIVSSSRKLALPLEVFSPAELLPTDVAGEESAVVVIHSEGEVLTSHADRSRFPAHARPHNPPFPVPT